MLAHTIHVVQSSNRKFFSQVVMTVSELEYIFEVNIVCELYLLYMLSSLAAIALCMLEKKLAAGWPALARFEAH
jgi:hypothetical protein